MKNTLNKQELVDRIAENHGIKKKDAARVISALTQEVMNAVAEGNKITLVGFGSFEPKKRNARTGRNPQSGKEMIIPERVVPAFSAGKDFKTRVEGGVVS